MNGDERNQWGNNEKKIIIKRGDVIVCDTAKDVDSER